MRKVIFANGDYYHIYNRGTEKRNVFLSDGDHRRFLAKLENYSSDRSIRIISYCLMPNHYHLLLQQLRDKGISTFMHRIGVSYGSYFNKKNDRKGRLFASTYHAVPIESTGQLLHIARYIHLNPLDLFTRNWKISGIPNIDDAMRFLQSYPWSSYRYFIGLQQRSFVDAGIYREYFSHHADYVSFTREWIETKSRELLNGTLINGEKIETKS